MAAWNLLLFKLLFSKPKSFKHEFPFFPSCLSGSVCVTFQNGLSQLSPACLLRKALQLISPILQHLLSLGPHWLLSLQQHCTQVSSLLTQALGDPVAFNALIPFLSFLPPASLLSLSARCFFFFTFYLKQIWKVTSNPLAHVYWNGRVRGLSHTSKPPHCSSWPSHWLPCSSASKLQFPQLQNRAIFLWGRTVSLLLGRLVIAYNGACVVKRSIKRWSLYSQWLLIIAIWQNFSLKQGDLPQKWSRQPKDQTTLFHTPFLSKTP